MKQIKIHLIVIFLITIGCKNNEKQQLKFTAKTPINIPFKDSSNTALPSLITNKKGKVFLSWIKKINDSVNQLNYAKIENNKWSTPKKITRGEKWFINWADYPTIAENNGNFISHILKNTTNTKRPYAYDVKLNVLKSKDEKWKTDITLHNDKTQTEHGFVTLIPYKDHFFATWLDGRNTGSNKPQIKNEEHSGHSGAMIIKCAEILKDGTIINRKLLDTKTCTCCQTTATITKNGPIVLYRDRTDNEIRDIAITRYVDSVWTAPQPIYNDQWKIEGCPVNGPRVDAIENNVAVAWFTGAKENEEIKIIFSEDGGANFLPPILISNNNVLGRVDVKLLAKNIALVSWMEMVAEKTFLRVIKVNSLGEKSKIVTIAEMENSRLSGFPQMEYSNNNIYFAWTTVKNKKTTIKTAYLPLQ